MQVIAGWKMDSGLKEKAMGTILLVTWKVVQVDGQTGTFS